MRALLTLVFTLIAAASSAQTAFPCDWQARADAIVEPWETNSATFANGAVRVAMLDVIEPAAAAYYLMILHPPYDDVGGRQCTTVGISTDLGYAGMYFDELQAGYDPAKGLTLHIPAVIYLPEQDFQNSTLLSISVNQSTGDVQVTQALGHE